MCNLYSFTKASRPFAIFFRIWSDTTGYLPPMPGIFPHCSAPIVRDTPDARADDDAVGQPSSQKAILDATQRRAQKLEAKDKTVDFKELLRMDPDKGTTNIRNVKSQHWRRWLNPENRCLVPFTGFSEFNARAGGDIWFAFGGEQPLAFLRGFGQTGRACGK